MKEYILSRLESVQLVMDSLNKLRDEHDPWTNFNYYWDYLDFINWMQKNHPADYELYELETDFEILDEFGDVYVKVVEPARLIYLYRHDDGILNIDAPLPKMIKQFYDYIISLQESELVALKSEPAPDTLSLKDIMDELLAVRAEVSSALSKPAADTRDLAKEVVKEVLSPTKMQKNLTEKEQFEADIDNKMAERKLKMLQNASKQHK